VSTCVTTGRSPPACGLDPALQSRLAAGLQFHVPTRQAETPT
jgi:hypothetical protein